MEVPSLRPEVGLELFKLILLRESYIRRLQKRLKQLGKSHVDLSLIGLIDLLRDTTIQVVDMIDTWEKTQLDYPVVKPFTWNQVNYLQKIHHDIDFIDDYPQIRAWLGFPVYNNPFLAPPEIFSPLLVVPKDALIIFGNPAEKKSDGDKSITKEKKTFKSPYTTPIINDPEVFSHLSARNKLDQKFKGVAKKSSADDNALIAQDTTELPPNPYQCYLSQENIERIRKCWKKLHIGLGLPLPIAPGTFEASQLGGFSSAQLPPMEMSMHSAVEGIAERDSSFVAGPSLLEQSTYHGTGEMLTSFSPNRNLTQSLNINKDVNFVRDKDNFYQSLYALDEDAYRKVETLNETHRISKFLETNSISSKEVEPKLSMTHSQLWTPHEIHLQRKVQRRGGELYVLTAAGVKGRLKAPWRRTRYQRMESDLGQLEQLSDQLGMQREEDQSELLRLSGAAQDKEAAVPSSGATTASPVQLSPQELQQKFELIKRRVQDKVEAQQDVDVRTKFLKEQYNYFKMVSENGTLTDIDKQRQLHQLEEGQSREADQLIALKLEDNMARRLQGLVRRRFGRILRKAQVARRNRAAVVIQCQYRTTRVNRSIKLRTQQLRLAIMVQRAYGMYKAGVYRRQLQLEAKQRFAVMLIQRCYRGYRGRRRLNLKRTFIRSLNAAREAVALLNLKPGDIEELADGVEDYVRDYSIRMPLAVLTLLRGVLYLFNGDASECIIVTTDEGYVEKRFIHAGSASWSGVKLILRRKGRFLRRLRSLVKNSLLPNPSKIVMSADCQQHTQAILDELNPADLEEVVRGQYALKQLYTYVVAVTKAFALQELFPEYFEPGLPFWFRHLMRIREDFDRADMQRRIESKAHARIEEVKRTHAREGKKYRHISQAVKRNRKELEHAKQCLNKMKERFGYQMQELKASEDREVLTLEAIVRAKTLAKEIADADLREYMRCTLIPDEQYIKELQYNVDIKNITLLQAKADLILCQERNERNMLFREFEKIMKVKTLHEHCGELGKNKADLLVLLEAWNALLGEIGGSQYIKDLHGERLTRYQVIQSNCTRLLTNRIATTQQLEDELKLQYSKVYDIINQSNLRFVGKKWDVPTNVEVEYEDYENRECSKRDYEAEFRKRRQLESIQLTSPYGWTPLVLFMDVKLPREFTALVRSSLATNFNFVVRPWDDLVDSTAMDSNGKGVQEGGEKALKTIQDQLQDIFDAKKNLIIMINRGFHYLARVYLDNAIAAVINVLVPEPRVVFLSAENCFSTDLWLEQSSIDRRVMFTPRGVTQQFSTYDLILGKLRKLASHFYRMLRVFPFFIKNQADDTSYYLLYYQESKRRSALPTYFQAQFASDFQDYLLSIRRHLLSVAKRVEAKKDAKKQAKLQAKELVARSRTSTAAESDILTKKSTTTNTRSKTAPDASHNNHASNKTASRPMSAIPPTTTMPITADKENIEDEMDEIFRELDDHVLMDFLLAMNLSIVWGLYNAPMTNWTSRDILKGVMAFREFLATVSIAQLCQKFQDCTSFNIEQLKHINAHYTDLDHMIFVQQQLRQNEQFSHLWSKCKLLDYFRYPARAMMTNWLAAMVEFIIMTPALSKEEVPAYLPYHHIVKPFYDDVVTVMTSNEARNAMIGDLLHLLLAPRIVHENQSPVWKLFYDRDCMHSVETQSLGTQLFRNSSHIASSKVRSMKHIGGGDTDLAGHGVISDRSQLSKVVVYHHGEEILIELQVNLTKESVKLLDAKSVHVLQRVGLLPRPQGKSKAGKTREADQSNPDNPQSQLANSAADNSEVIACMKTDQCYRFFSRMFTNDVLLLIQPNFTEIFEGNIQKPLSQLILESDLGYVVDDDAINTELTYDQFHEKNHSTKATSSAVSKETGYYHCVSNWTCVDSIGGKLSTSTIRARYLILSKLGSISGYYVRLEIFEERYGEIRILLFGLSENDYEGGGDGKKTAGKGSAALLTNTTDMALAALQQQEAKSEKVIFQIKVDKAYVYQVLNFCDEFAERDKLESSDTFAMAYIFSDRLCIQPSYNWFHFLSFHDFLPIQIRTQDKNNVDSSAMFDLRFRQKGGPGRLVGRRLLNVHKMFFKPETKQTFQPSVPSEHDEDAGDEEEEGGSKDDENMEEDDEEDLDEEDLLKYFNHRNNKLLVLLSIYEINNETNSHELRLVLYHFYDCQMVEYRVSAMERVMLFRDDEPLVDQLLQRMRLVYCDVGKSQLESFQRVVLPMTELGSDKSVLSSLVLNEYEVEGDEEYEVRSVDSDPDDEDEEEDSLVEADSMADSSTSTAKKRKIKALLKKHKGKHSKQIQEEVVEDIKERIIATSGWAWALYFDRAPLSEVHGNLVVSIVFSVQKKGFFFTVRDPRSLHEASKFITFAESIPFFQNKTLEILESEISNLDESVTFDIIDDLFSAIEIADLDSGGTGVVLQLDLATAQANLINEQDNPTAALDLILRPSQPLTDLVLAKIREIPEDKLYNPMSRKQGGSSSYRISLEIFRAKDLARIGIVGMRNAYAVLKYNMREIGRTAIVKGTLQPDWSKAGTCSFDVHINKESLLMSCALDVEVYDTDVKGNTGDFLGVVRLQGGQLKAMMIRDSFDDGNATDADKYKQFCNLEPSKKLGDKDNKHVQGKIELRATLKVIGDALQNPLMKQSMASPDAFLRAQDEMDERARKQMSDFNPTLALALPAGYALDSKLNKLSSLSSEQLLASFKYFDVYLKELDLSSLTIESMLHSKQYQVLTIPKDAELVLSVSVNHIEVCRKVQPFHSNKLLTNPLCCHQPVLPAHDELHHADAEVKKVVVSYEGSSPVECRLPILLPVGLCQLRVDVQLRLPSVKADPNQPLKSNLIPLGTLELQGPGLKEVVRRAYISEVQHQQLLPALQYTLPAHHAGNGRSKAKPSPYKVSGYANLSLITSIGSKSPCKHYKVSIKSARNLAKADTFGKSDPYVRVFFNQHLLGQTSFVKNTLSPSFANQNEDFLITIPNEMAVEDCVLEVQVIDHDNMSQGDLLGVRVITGEELVHLLQLTPPPWIASNLSHQPPSTAALTEFWKSRGCELNNSQKSVYFTLQPAAHTPSDLDQVAQVKGDVEVKATFVDPFHQYSPPSASTGLVKSKEKESHSNNFHMPAKYGQYHHQDIALEVLNHELNAVLWEKELESVGSKIERELGELPSLKLLLTVHAAKGLANADTFGKSDPFVRIWWNGHCVGMTSTVDDSLDPVWHEEFDLPLATGQQLDSCFLELEVYDRDGAKEGEFLGMLYLSGSQVLELVEEYNAAKSISTAAAATGLGIKSYPLKPSAYHSDKENMLAKGNIQLSMKPIFSEESNKWSASSTGPELSAAVEALHVSESYDIPIEEPTSQSVKIFYNFEFFLSNFILTNKSNLPNLEILQKKEHDDQFPIVAKIWFNGCLWYHARGRLDSKSHHVTWRLSSFAETTRDAGKSIKKKQQQDQTAAVGHFVFRIPAKLNVEDNFLQVTFFYQPTSSAEHQPTEFPSSYFLGGTTLTGKLLTSFLKFPEAVEDHHYNKKHWHKVGLVPLLSVPITVELVSAAQDKLKSVDDYSHIAKDYLVKAKVETALKMAKLVSKADVVWLGEEHSRYQRMTDFRSKCLRIGSTLEEEQMDWCYDYDLGGQRPADWKDSNSVEEEEDSPTAKTLPKTASYRDAGQGDTPSTSKLANTKLPSFSSNPLLNARSKPSTPSALIDEKRAKSAKNIINDRRRGTPSAPKEAPKELSAVQTHATSNPGVVVEEVVDTTTPVLDIPRFKLELAAVNFTVTIQGKYEEDFRVYWRGKVIPKNISFANEDMKKMVFASRSSRLLRNKNINELEVMSEVHYVKEFGDELVGEAEKQASLPVCVKEVLSSGPGLVQRTFRIEMITNTNILLGSTEIADNVLDFYRVVGSDAIPKIIHRNTPDRLLSEKEWDYTTIFEHIVQDRLELNMMSAAPPPTVAEESPNAKKPTGPPPPPPPAAVGEDGTLVANRKRKKAISVANTGGHAGDLSSGSVIFVRRDEEALVRNYDETFLATVQPIHEGDEEEDAHSEHHDSSSKTSEEQSQSARSGSQDYESASESAPSSQDEQEDGATESSSKKDRKQQKKKNKKSKKVKKPKQIYALRIFSKSYRLTGKMFRSIVLFTSESEPALAEHPDYYFRSMYPQFQACQTQYNSDLKLLFRCQDCITKKLYSIEIPATALWEAEWLPGEFPYPDLSTKFRRDKLGGRLMAYVGLRFLRNGDFSVEFNIENHMNHKRTKMEDLVQVTEAVEENLDDKEEDEDGNAETKVQEDSLEDDSFFNDLGDSENDDEDSQPGSPDNNAEKAAQATQEPELSEEQEPQQAVDADATQPSSEHKLVEQQ